MKNKWVLSGTHEGGRYAYQCFSDGLYCATAVLNHRCPFSFLFLLSLLTFLSEEFWNAARPWMKGKRKRDGKRGRVVSLGADKSPL